MAHIGMLLGSFVVPLALHLSTDRQDRWTRAHTAEALNMALTFLIVWGVVIVGSFILSAAVAPALFAVLFLLGFALYVVHLVWGIKAATRAGRYEEWRYPVRIAFVSGGF